MRFLPVILSATGKRPLPRVGLHAADTTQLGGDVLRTVLPETSLAAVTIRLYRSAAKKVFGANVLDSC